MQAARLFLLFLLPSTFCLMTGCSQEQESVPVVPAGAKVKSIQLSAAQKAMIGRKIWQNESGGKVTGLTHWNDGEEFPSLGIGHFIWYPTGFDGRWTETWPEFVTYATSRGHAVPAVGRTPDCPWPNKTVFMQDFNGPRLSGLRQWLASNIAIQTEFIAYKSRAALPKIMEAAPIAERPRIKANYEKVASTPQGVYALVDYVNFKGDGTNPRESYGGEGWGLMWVLMEMKNVPAGPAAAREFGEAAKRRLDLRIRNSPPARGEARWRAGWHNRCESYGRPL